MTMLILIAGLAVGCGIWFAAQAAQMRIHPERLLRRLQRNAARKIMQSMYRSSFGTNFGDKITSLVMQHGLVSFDKLTLSVDDKLDIIEKLAGVTTYRELDLLFKHGYSDDLLLEMLTKLYDDGELSYIQARVFDEPKRTNPSASYNLDELKSLTWANV